MQGCSVCNKYRCYTAVLVFILHACLNTSKQFALMCTNVTQHYMWMIICIQMNPEANLLARVSQKHRIHSKSYWFTETCNSQCLLHFAAPFMVVQAETSIAENVFLFVVTIKSILQQCLTELQQLFGHAKIAAASNFRAEAEVSACPKLTHACHLQHQKSTRMILPQVHLRKPCYDFSFL